MTVALTGSALTLDELLAVARAGDGVRLAGDVPDRVRAGRDIVEQAIGGEPVYGLNTGVGVRKRVRVAPEELADFNRRSILEHRVGQGEAAPAEVVRAQLLVIANAFARGTSGVRLE